MSTPDLTDRLIPIMSSIADEVIVPRFRALAEGEVDEKSPGELVTIADREAEIRLTEALTELLPVPVVGEEAVETHPSLLNALANDGRCWLVDPLDGTANFVAGKETFAVMIALVEAGETIASWIWLPLTRIAYVAERGNGAYRNGVRLTIPTATSDPAAIRGAIDDPTTYRGAILQKFLTPEQRAAIATATSHFAVVGPGQYCAGVEYPRIAEGKQEFVRFQRLRPWDHAPGTLLLEEAGGYVRRWDGSPYAPGRPGEGLLATANADIWREVRAAVPLD